MTENGVTINDPQCLDDAPRFEELHKPKDLHYTDAGSEHLARKSRRGDHAGAGKVAAPVARA
jgi:hypothetical protein